MAQVVGLFSASEKAGQAVLALDALELEEGSIRTIESPGEVDAVGAVTAAPFPPSGSPRGTAVVQWSGLDDLDIDEEAAAFFQRSLEDGATLVVADVDDEQATAVQALMEQHGGRVASG